MENTIIETKELVRNYRVETKQGTDTGTIHVLKGIDFKVEEGEFTAIMGKSGCGKTTFLKLLGLLDRPTDGKIYFNGMDTEELWKDELADIRRRKIGFVFQDFYLMNSLSVMDNIMLPMILDKAESGAMKEKAENLAEQFEISGLLHKAPYELSGGEKQRVAICRALIHDPDIIFADEPTGSLDSKAGKNVMESLNRINEEFNKTIVMVTHDPQLASYCRKLVLLKDGEILETLHREGSQDEFYTRILGKISEL